MSLSSRANIANFAIALCAACASQRSAESHADYAAQTQTTKTEGAERVTVLEFGPVEGDRLGSTATKAESADTGTPSSQSLPPPFLGAVTRRSAPARSLWAADESLPPHGPLLKATVIERAPVVTTTNSGTDLHTDAESSSKWHLGPGFWGWVGLAFGAAAAALIAWRFRAGLLGGVLKLIGR